MTGRKLKLLGDDRREQQQYIDSGAETLTSAADYFSGRIQELGEKVEQPPAVVFPSSSSLNGGCAWAMR